MNYFSYFITICFLFSSVQGLHMKMNSQNNLTPKTWKQMRGLLLHPSTSFRMKDIIQKQMFESYKAWSIHYGRKKYKNIIRRNFVRQGDIDVSSMHGLWNAVETYNATFPSFYRYAKKCVDWSLYMGVREMAPLTMEPLYKRNRQPFRPAFPLLFQEEKETEKIDIRDESNVKNEQEMESEMLWSWIYSMEPSVSRMFKYKYDFLFNTIRSNREVGELMCVHEEQVRKTLQKTKQILELKIAKELRNTY